MPRPILFSLREGIGLLRLNRPEVLNALNREVYRALVRRLERIADDGGVRALVIAGRGRAFCAGTDIAELAGATAEEARDLALLENRAFCMLEDLPQPTVAAVQGYALGGGCELALACDLRLTAEGAVFGQPEIDLGWIPAAGGTFRLPATVGRARAKEMIFTGKRIDATEADRIGLVNRVVPEGDLIDEALRLAGTLAEKDPKAMRYAKQALSRTVDREAAVFFEARVLAECGAAPEAQKRIQRFLSERKGRRKGEKSGGLRSK